MKKGARRNHNAFQPKTEQVVRLVRAALEVAPQAVGPLRELTVPRASADQIRYALRQLRAVVDHRVKTPGKKGGHTAYYRLPAVS